jgi:hypothetical protein
MPFLSLACHSRNATLEKPYGIEEEILEFYPFKDRSELFCIPLVARYLDIVAMMKISQDGWGLQQFRLVTGGYKGFDYMLRRCKRMLSNARFGCVSIHVAAEGLVRNEVLRQFVESMEKFINWLGRLNGRRRILI